MTTDYQERIAKALRLDIVGGRLLPPIDHAGWAHALPAKIERALREAAHDAAVHGRFDDAMEDALEELEKP